MTWRADGDYPRIALHSVVSVRFGSVSVSSICYRPGSVHVRFRFLRFLVDFGSVRCLEHSTLIFAFFPAPEKQIQIASCKRFIASRKRFHEPRLSKSGES